MYFLWLFALLYGVNIPFISLWGKCYWIIKSYCNHFPTQYTFIQTNFNNYSLEITFFVLTVIFVYDNGGSNPIILSSNIFLSVANDFANRWTDMVLLYMEASYRPRDCFRLFHFHKKSLGRYDFRLFFCPSMFLRI